MGKESAFGAVLRNRALRRLQYAVLGSMLGRMAFVVAGAVWAYDEGGALGDRGHGPGARDHVTAPRGPRMGARGR